MTTAVDELKTVLTRHQRDWAAPWASDGHGTLVGRGADLDWIGAFIAGVPRAGGPLLLMGEPGVGKTALLAAGGRQAKASGICVLATAGVEYKARLSYVGVQQLLDAAAGRQPSIRLSGPLTVVLGRADGLAPGTWTRGGHRGHAVVAPADGAQQADAAGGRRTPTPKPIHRPEAPNVGPHDVVTTSGRGKTGRSGDSPRHRTGTIPVRKHQYTRPGIGETT